VGNLASILEVVLATLAFRLILIRRTGDGHGARPAWTLQTLIDFSGHTLLILG